MNTKKIYVLLPYYDGLICEKKVKFFESFEDSAEYFLKILEKETSNNYFYKRIQELKEVGLDALRILEVLDDYENYSDFTFEKSNYNGIYKPVKYIKYIVANYNDIYKPVKYIVERKYKRNVKSVTLLYSFETGLSTEFNPDNYCEYTCMNYDLFEVELE